jgi:hypothetical protein
MQLQTPAPGDRPTPLAESAALDLVRYDSQQHPFVDRQGHLSLSFSGPLTVGPQWVHPRGVMSTYDIVNPVLKLWAIDDGRWVAARRTRLHSWPWAAEEEGELAGLSVATRYVFVDERTIAADFVVTNPSPSSVSVALAWTGMGVADHRLYMLDYFDGARRTARDADVSASHGGAGVVVALRAGAACDLPDVRVTIDAATVGVRASVADRPAWAATDDAARPGPFFRLSSRCDRSRARSVGACAVPDRRRGRGGRGNPARGGRRTGRRGDRP